jgi:hypothetical protein
LYIDKPVNLDTRLAAPVEPVGRRFFFFQGKNPLFQLIHGGLPQRLRLFSFGDGALSSYFVSKE